MSSASQKIDEYLATLPGWQRQKLTGFRKLVHKAEPNIQEEWKWAVPVFLVDGRLVCAMSTFKDHTKFNFFEGAALQDEHGLFNSGLDSKKHRSINLREGEALDTKALSNLLQEAITRVRG